MQQVHLIGIGGTGLSAIALVLLERGVRVTGSDRQDSPLAQRVRAAGGEVTIGHKAENVRGADLVVRSSAISEENVEVQAARAAGIPVLKREDFLGRLTNDRQVVAVAGSHGKTTTTAMIAWMLKDLGQDPSYIIGGVSNNLGSNAHAGQGEIFVVEADEYDRMFLGLRPDIAVVTNIEHDHPDCYPTPADFYGAFLEFTARITQDGLLIACADDPGAAQLLKDAAGRGQRTRSYGIAIGERDFQAQALVPNDQGGFTFQVVLPQSGPESPATSLRVALRVPGMHNVRNALAALAVAYSLHLPMDAAVRALEAYQGTGRRFEVRGEAAGVVVVDDYAHHPTEIRATLEAARQRFPGHRLWAVWQPHTYSRTRTLFTEFLSAFSAAHKVLVTDIYAARERPPADGFSARQVVQAMQHPSVLFAGTVRQAASLLAEQVQEGDVVLVLSAGDGNRIGELLLQALREPGSSAGRIVHYFMQSG